MRPPRSLLPVLRRAHFLSELLTACLFSSLLLPAQAVAPSWWTSRNVIDPTKTPDDYAAINQGQIKKLTAAAVAEMEDKLNGGAGNALKSIVNKWGTHKAEADDYAVVTVGQLKHLAKPIYQRLFATGAINALPSWVTFTASSNDDFAIANIGQAKHLFSFPIPNQNGNASTVPTGWQGSKWTENPMDVPESEVNHHPFPNGTLKDFYVRETLGLSTTSENTSLEMRKADLWGIVGHDIMNLPAQVYSLRNGKNDGIQNPYDPYSSERVWWTSLPPRILSSTQLSNTWNYFEHLSTPNTPPSSPSDYVALSLRKNDHTWSGNPNSSDATITGQSREERWSEVRLRLSDTRLLSDRQIIREYWRSDDYALSQENAHRYRFVINKGTSYSSQQINFTASDGKKVFLILAPPRRSKNIAPVDVAGPRYRKIGLNGVPLSDTPPQNQQENDIPADETYIDAYSRTLRHAVTDIWSKVGSTELPLAVRRTNIPETWSWNGSIRPIERTDRPFGMGFSSNLTPQITFQTTSSPGPNAHPVRATVVDEQGTTRSFVQIRFGVDDIWVPDLDQKQDAKTCFDRLVRCPNTDPVVWELHKKFGTTCRYEMMFKGDSRTFVGSFGGGSIQRFPADRQNGSESNLSYQYGRMRNVIDRQGNELRYTYPDDNAQASALQSFIPSKIHDPTRPSQAVHIAQDNGLIKSIRGPSGELVHYQYTFIDPDGNGPQPSIPVLNRVIKGANEDDEDAVVVLYSLAYSEESELDVDPTSPQASLYGHIDINAITDERNYIHHFGYADLSDSAQTTSDYSNGYYSYNKRQCGGPRMVKTILRPNGQTVTFGGNRGIHYDQSGNVTLTNPSGLTTTVTSSTTGTYTYSFNEPHIFCPVPLSADSPQNVIASFRKMTISSPAGTEIYEFDPEAGMALKRAQDVSGNITSYTYEDAITSPSAALVNYGLLKFDDPTTETNAIHTGEVNGVKRYEYEPNYRLLKKVTDEKGTVTEYNIDGIGRRTQEKITQAGGRVLRVTEFKYENPIFAGFMTQQIIKTTGLGAVPGGIPNPTGELRTDFESDSNGRIKQQKVYIDAAATQPLITSYTYTGNGSKRTVTDPRNHTTSFEYEPHTLRLKKVTYPDATWKTLAYDAHGNLTEEVNEIGAKTFHEYDVLNRRIKSTLNLNGDDNPDPSYTKAGSTPGTVESDPVYDGDIVTLMTYNDFNLPVDETDARGVVTHHDYDTAGRRIRTTVNTDGNPASVSEAELITEYIVPINGQPDWVGGSMFDVSGFKPLRIKDPRGFVTEFEYDKLYRTTRTTLHDTSYTPTQDVVTQTEYDQVGNAVKVTDPLGNVTRTDYDGLNRAIKTVLPTKAGGIDSNVSYAEKRMAYTPSGQVWSSTDELGNITYNVYDGAGRLITTLMPAVETPEAGGQFVRPKIWQSYDEAGNLMEKSDAKGNITRTEYDTRNRPVKVIMPEVLDAGTGLTRRPETITQYDNAGRVISVEDPLHRISYSAYDLAGRCFRTIAPPTGLQTHVTLTEHDPAGNALTVTDAKGQTVTNTYDNLNRLRTTVDYEGILNSFSYDKAGNRTSVKDGLEQETLFAYDAQKRLREQEFANGDTWTYFYDAVNKTGQKDAKQVETAYIYDVRNRLRKVSAPDLERRQAYDNAGRLISVAETGRAEATVGYAYDALARVTSETSQGITHTYRYDLAGNRVRAEYGTDRTVITAYDTLNRPATIAESGHITTYGYDLAGRALTLTAGNGQVTRNVYDEIGRLTHRSLYASAADLSPAGVIAEFGWGHDAVGNVTAHSEQWKANASRPAGTRTTSMTYDGINRLDTEVISDPTSGITVTTYTYDEANNRESKTVAGGSDPGYWHYDYNEANQLIGWTKHDEPNGTLLKSAGLGYDLNGNRTSLEVVGQSGTSSHASLSDQGVTYTAIASGSTGNGVSISLKCDAANQALGASVAPGDHLVVNLATGPASVDTLVDQGITYTTNNVHQAGEEVSITLLADEPGQEEEEVQVDGRDITVKLATSDGAPATGTLQDIAYQASAAGPGGNDLKVHLKKATLGQEASVSRTGNAVTVNLETDSGSPDTLVNQGITYTTTVPHQQGRDVSVELVAKEPNQAPGVQVNGNAIKVLLDTDAGQPAYADDQGIHYEAVASGPEGDELSVSIQAVGTTDPFSVTLPVAPSKQIVAHFPVRPWGTASLTTLPGVTYQAKAPGLAGNDIIITHAVADGPGQSTSVARLGNDVTVHLGTDMGKQAQASFYPDKGGLTVKAAQAGLVGNNYSIEVKLATVPNSSLQASLGANLTTVTLASNASGNPTTTVAQLASFLNTLYSPNRFVATGTSSQVITAAQTRSLTGGGTDYQVIATGSDVATAVAASTATKTLLQAQASSGNPILQTGTGQLTGGNNPVFSNDLADLLAETPGVSDLISVSGGNGNPSNVESVPLQPATVQLCRSGARPRVETTVSQLVALINGHQTLVTASGSGTDKIMPLPHRVLGGGTEPAIVTKTDEVVTLLSEDSQINDLIIVTGGSPTEVAQTGSVELSGGGLGFALHSVPSSVAAAINNHSTASSLITASGSATNGVGPLARTALRGGAPAILSTASDVVTLLSGHSLVTATGSGSTVLHPMERTFLSSTVSRTTYTWNSQDRLTGVKTPDGTRHGYTYDYRARRVQTTRHNGPQPAQTTAIVFSGGLSLAEYESTAPGSFTVNAPTVHYLRGPDMGGGVGGMLYSIRGSDLRYSLSNGRGDIIAQSDEDAELTWTASYEAFGKRPAETGTNLDKQRANSKDEDPTGLLNEGFRYRDLETGVWLSRDPAGFVDGPNLYAYVMQNPWTSFDPEGLWLKEMLPKPFQSFLNSNASSTNAAAMVFNSIDGAIDTGIRTVGVFNTLREGGATPAQAGVAAGVYGVGSLSGALPVAEALDGNRIVSSEGGGVTTQGMTAGDRVIHGALGAVQMGMTFVGGSGGFSFKKPGSSPPPIKGQAAVVVEGEAVAKPPLNNSQLVQEVATRSEAWGSRRGIPAAGNGPVQGSLKHGYAQRLLDRYQLMYGNRGLQTEISYLKGQRVPYGTKGSVRLDVYEQSTGIVWDYKFTPNPSLPASRVQRIINNGPVGINSVNAVGP